MSTTTLPPLSDDLIDLLGLQDPSPQLNLIEAKFIDEYLKHGNAGAAALAAGLTPNKNHARQYGFKMIQRPHVALMLAKRREELAAKTGYTAEKAMQEAEEAMAFAKDTGNANALVKAVELRSKLQGLLIEKVQHQGAPFSINIGGISRETQSHVIDVTPAKREIVDGRT